MIVKQSKNWYTWLGKENLLLTLAKMRVSTTVCVCVCVHVHCMYVKSAIYTLKLFFFSRPWLKMTQIFDTYTKKTVSKVHLQKQMKTTIPLKHSLIKLTFPQTLPYQQ